MLTVNVRGQGLKRLYIRRVWHKQVTVKPSDFLQNGYQSKL